MQEVPKYRTLVNWLREQVETGQLKDGDKCYSENELSVLFGVSRQTVRQAIGILEQEKLVERRRGSGTYMTCAQEEKRSRTMNIGVIATYLDDYIFTAIIKGIEQVLTQNGYSMQIAFTHNHVQNEAKALYLMLEKNVDGILVEPTKSALPNPNLGIYKELFHKKIPLVFFNSYYPGTPFPHVALDDTKAGRLATEHLIGLGHRRIAGFFQSDDLPGPLRYAGYVEALLQAGLELRDENVLWYATEDKAELMQDAARILRRLDACTGLVCYNDQLAYSMVSFLRKNQLAVPEDISVVGIDNSELAAMCEVPLTSVSHPKQLLGETAAKNLVQLIENQKFDATVDFIPTLEERNSVCKQTCF